MSALEVIDPAAAHDRWVREHECGAETWMPVVGYEGLYEVSDLGRVRSLDRKDPLGRRLRGKMLKLRAHPRGYMQTTLTRDGVCVTKKIHRLVLEAFVGPCPSGMEACHDNGIRDDNRPSNLRWDTPRANAADRIAHGTQRGRSQTHCNRGHALVEPNLAPYALRHGRRACKSCLTGFRLVGKDDPRMQEIADARYAEIMGVHDADGR